MASQKNSHDSKKSGSQMDSAASTRKQGSAQHEQSQPAKGGAGGKQQGSDSARKQQN